MIQTSVFSRWENGDSYREVNFGDLSDSMRHLELFIQRKDFPFEFIRIRMYSKDLELEEKEKKILSSQKYI